VCVSTASQTDSLPKGLFTSFGNRLDLSEVIQIRDIKTLQLRLSASNTLGPTAEDTATYTATESADWQREYHRQYCRNAVADGNLPLSEDVAYIL